MYLALSPVVTLALSQRQRCSDAGATPKQGAGGAANPPHRGATAAPVRPCLRVLCALALVTGVVLMAAVRLELLHRNWNIASAVSTIMGVVALVALARRHVLRARARHRDALVALARLARSGTDSSQLLNRAVTVAAEGLGLQHCAILATQSGSNRLIMRAGVGWNAGVVGHATIHPESELKAGKLPWSSESVILRDVRTDARFAAWRVLLEHGVVSGVSVPIDGGDGLFGVLGCYAMRRRRFRREEIEFVESIARILAIVVGRQEEERTLAEESQITTALANVGRELISCLETPTLLDRLCELTTHVLGCEHSVTWLRQPDDDTFRAISAHGLPEGPWRALRSLAIPETASGPLLAALTRAEVVTVEPKSHRYPLVAQLLGRIGITQALFVPLRKGGEIIGLQASGYHHRRGDFGHQHVRIARGVGQLASLALMNARLVEEIERASQLKSEFVSTMSHELRTPLNIIVGYTDMLGDALTCEEQAPLLALVRRASIELLELIDATLNVNRLAAGGDAPHFATVSVPDLWSELRTDFDAFPRRTDAELRWDDIDNIEICTDRRKLKIVLKNLVGNALKFTPKGEVVASCVRQGAQCVFTVRDTGIGIPPEALVHVFDMFRQVDSSDRRSYSGAGLGLYIVRSFLTQLGGEVQVESEVGRGTTFRAVLPLEPVRSTLTADERAANETSALAREAAEVEQHLARVNARLVEASAVVSRAMADTSPRPAQRLLFADDLPLSRLLMRRFLAQEFPQVEMLEACDGEQALAMAEAYQPDLILLDLRMPEMDGLQAARRIRALEYGRDVPMVAISIDGSPSVEADVMRAGFKEFMLKPVSDYSALKERIAYWLRPDASKRPYGARGTSVPVCALCRRELPDATPEVDRGGA
jgi:signal transduction histidine kinase/ActR/RegA family two-component response regulator